MKQGYSLYALEQATNSINLMSFTPPPNDKLAFIFGNEVKGVSEEVLGMTAGVLEVPQFGAKHSFNVAVTAGIVLWDTISKLNKKKKGCKHP